MRFFFYSIIVFSLLLASSVSAQIQYHSFDPPIFLEAEDTFDNGFCNGDEYYWDVNNDGVEDARFWLKANCSYDGILSEATSALVVDQLMPIEVLTHPENVVYGGQPWGIDAANDYSEGWNVGPSSSGTWFHNPTFYWAFSYENFHAEDRYVAFRFDPGDGWHYGWFRLQTGSWPNTSLTLYEYAYQTIPGVPILTGEGVGSICPAFTSSPVDLNKSFNGPNGIVDRVQLKWYKESPQVKYNDADAAACDIKVWGKKTLDPETGEVTGNIYNPDTINLVDRKKFYPDGITPKENFKWPVKFRADGVNNTNRVDPNIRYQWQVRCACEHGEGVESPWSEVKTFNTPDFDPSSGVYTPLIGGEKKGNASKNVIQGLTVSPNPSDGKSVQLLGVEHVEKIVLVDQLGKMINLNPVQTKEDLRIVFPTHLKSGLYTILIENSNRSGQVRFIVE